MLLSFSTTEWLHSFITNNELYFTSLFVYVSITSLSMCSCILHCMGRVHCSSTIESLCLHKPCTVNWIEYFPCNREHCANKLFDVFQTNTQRMSLSCKSIPTHVSIGTTANKTHATYITPPLLEIYSELCLITSSGTDVTTPHSTDPAPYPLPDIPEIIVLHGTGGL